MKYKMYISHGDNGSSQYDIVDVWTWTCTSGGEDLLGWGIDIIIVFCSFIVFNDTCTKYYIIENNNKYQTPCHVIKL